MRGKDFLLCIASCLKKPLAFTNAAIAMRWKYVVFQFLVVCSLLYIPLLVSIIRTQPAQFYARLFSEDLDNLRISEHQTDASVDDPSAEDGPSLCVFEDKVVYSDSRITLSAPKELIFSEEMPPHTPQELFGMVAVYNGYIPRLLLPVLGGICAVVCVLQLLFCVMSACALGLYRMAASGFSFGERIKLSTMVSAMPAMVSMAFGFLIPGVHIILFQLLCLLLLFSLSRRYDAAEKRQPAEA